jgi:hypothetical protein
MLATYFRISFKASIKDTLIYKYSLSKTLEVLIEATTYIDSYIYKRELERKLEVDNYQAKTNSRAITTILNTNYTYYSITILLTIITRITSIINSNRSISIELNSFYISIIRDYKLLLIDKEK